MRSLADHQGIVDAIRTREPEVAANRMLSHLVSTTDELIRR
jgi:GntR family transcriptional regulator, transcriptional repressor for pyruvate dehydrogenase complex